MQVSRQGELSALHTVFAVLQSRHARKDILRRENSVAQLDMVRILPRKIPLYSFLELIVVFPGLEVFTKAHKWVAALRRVDGKVSLAGRTQDGAQGGLHVLINEAEW